MPRQNHAKSHAARSLEARDINIVERDPLPIFLEQLRGCSLTSSLANATRTSIEGVISEHKEKFRDFGDKVLALIERWSRDRVVDIDLINRVPVQLSSHPYTSEVCSGAGKTAVTVRIEYTPASRGFIFKTPALLRCQLFSDCRSLSEVDTLQLSLPGKPHLPATNADLSETDTWSSGKVIERAHEFLSRIILVALNHSAKLNKGFPEADLSEDFEVNLVREVARASHLAALPGFFASTVRHEQRLTKLHPLILAIHAFDTEWKELTSDARRQVERTVEQISTRLEDEYSLKKEEFARSIEETYNKIQAELPSVIIHKRQIEIERLEAHIAQIRARDNELSSDARRQALTAAIVTGVSGVLEKHEVTSGEDIIRCSRSLTQVITGSKTCRLEPEQILSLFDAFLCCANDELRSPRERKERPRASAFKAKKLEVLMAALKVCVSELRPENYDDFIAHFRDRGDQLTSTQVLKITKQMLGKSPT
jgi:hypothetical protein